MRVLIDTNIFIHLEDSSILDGSLAELDRIHRVNTVQIFVHPASYEDIQRDRDEVRRERCLSRLGKYPHLINPPDHSDDFKKQFDIEAKKPNDSVDILLLSAVYGETVSFLITEDVGIHQKAKRMGLDERVFFVDEAASYLRSAFSVEPVNLPNLSEVNVYEILRFLDTSFFDSLRDSYGVNGFNDWFKKISREGRKAWYCEDSTGDIGAVCIYKEESGETITTNGKILPGKSLKLCCFKVEGNLQGRKVGELFLKAAFRYATNNKCENTYITMFSEKLPKLVQLCKDFGFIYTGKNRNGEDVFCKSHPLTPPVQNISALDYHKSYSPHFRAGRDIGVFLVPIEPRYHNKLFPDYHQNQDIQLQFHQITEMQGVLLPGNAIKQAYLCHANIKSIKPGDILLFYRSQDSKEVTTVGIVEMALHLNNLERVIEYVTKRTVYNRKELEVMVAKPCLTILFRLAVHLPQPIKWAQLKELGINGNIQSIRSVDSQLFKQLISVSRLKNCFYAD